MLGIFMLVFDFESFNFDDVWLCDLTFGLSMPIFFFVELSHKYTSMTLWRYGERSASLRNFGPEFVLGVGISFSN